MFDAKLIRKLNEGHVFKNYGDLCDTLKVKRKAGNSKVSQLKELGRYIKLKKEGHKLIVEEVYEKPKFDYRGVHARELRELYFMKQLNKQVKKINTPYVYITQKNLMFDMGILDKQFKQMSVGDASDFLGVKYNIFYDNWHLLTHSLSKSYILKILDNLEDKLLIKYELMYIANTGEGLNEEFRELGKEEVSEILRIERESLEKINKKNIEVRGNNGNNVRQYKRITDVMFSKDAGEFYEANRRVVKELGINFFFKAFKISLVTDELEEDILDIERRVSENFNLNFKEGYGIEDAILNQKLNLINDNFREQYIRNAHARHNDAMKNRSITDNEKLKIVRRSSQYISDSEKIIKSIIATH